MEVDEGAGGDLSQEDEQEAGEVLGEAQRQPSPGDVPQNRLGPVNQAAAAAPRTHQAQQTAHFVNGAHAAEDSQEHGEGADADQQVAGDLHGCGVICVWGSRRHRRVTLSAAELRAAETRF